MKTWILKLVHHELSLREIFAIVFLLYWGIAILSPPQNPSARLMFEQAFFGSLLITAICAIAFWLKRVVPAMSRNVIRLLANHWRRVLVSLGLGAVLWGAYEMVPLIRYEVKFEAPGLITRYDRLTGRFVRCARTQCEEGNLDH